MINVNERYLIAIDLDGTLLNDEKTISPLTIEVLQTLEKHGCFIVLCTGRALRGVEYYHDKVLKLKHSPVICYNGHMATNPHDKSFKTITHLIDKEIIKGIYKELVDKDLINNAMSENLSTIYVDKHDDFLFEFYDKSGMKVVDGPLNKTLDQDVFTCVINFGEKTDSEIANKISAVVDAYQDTEVRFWYGGDYCELYGTDISKSKAIQEVASFYSIDKNHVIVFGDSDNDVEMLRDFKHSYVMRNGNPSLFGIAHNITDFTNNDDGVAKELIKLFNIRI